MPRGKSARRRSCMVCEVCDTTFNSQDHKPLVLPCGHTFCKSCIDEVFSESDKNTPCPKCRKSITKCRFPVCYQLIPAHDSDSDDSDEDKKEHDGDEKERDERDEEEQCDIHREKLVHWCTSCKCQLCPECIHPRHENCMIASVDCLMMEDSNMLLRVLQVLPEDIDEFGNKLENLCEDYTRKDELLSTFMQSSSQAWTSLQKEMNFLNVTKARLDFEHPSCATNAPLKRKKKRRVMQQCSRIFEMKENYRECAAWIENLCHFAEFFESEEESAVNEARPVFIEEFLKRSCHPMEPCTNWLVETDTQAHLAHKALAYDPSLKPQEITLKTTFGPIHTAKLLLPFFAANAQSLKLQMLDDFWQNTSGPFPDTNDDMLESLLQCTEKSKLQHFMGCMTHETLLQLRTVKLNTLGLHVHSHEFVNSINTSLCLAPAVLHLCVHRHVEADLLPALIPSLHEQCSLHLHFCDLRDSDLTWLCEVVSRLVPAGRREFRVQSIFLPRCQLSCDGLLTLLERLSCHLLSADVSCDSDVLCNADLQYVSSKADIIKIKFNSNIEL